MQFKYKNKKYSFPTSLIDVTLGQRIEFEKVHGTVIAEMQKEVYKVDEKGEKLPADEVEVMLLNIQIANRNFSFFTGIPLEEVEKNIPIETVISIYHSCFEILYQEQDNIELEAEYLFNEEFWKIEKPELSYQSELTFNELICSKQIVKQMHDMGAGNWESMPFLAAIFLKREGEVFDESWLNPEGERIKLMYELPMNIAVSVGFFLAVSTSLFLTTSQYSEEEVAQKDQI